VLSPELTGNPVLLKRFEREARAAAKLSHENIVEVYELGEDNGVHFIAMEYVEGVDALRCLRQRGPLTEAAALEVIRQAARALDHAHQHGIVHRDVKPSNLILTRQNGRPLVKLTDFGLVRDLQNQDESHLTRMGAAVGTVDYMAPEQAKGSHLADIRSDLYSLGCTLYHLLTGRPPFAEGEFLEKLYKHVHAHPPDPRDFRPELSDDVVLLLGRLLEKRPQDRFATPAALLQEIERVQGKEQPYVLAMIAEEAAAPDPPVARLANDSTIDGSSEQRAPQVSAVLVLAAFGLLVVLGLILYVFLS
jgi:serine/threonine protein kinase